MWISPKIKESMTMKQSMVIGLCDPNVTERPKSLLNLELAIIGGQSINHVDKILTIFDNTPITHGHYLTKYDYIHT